MIIKALLINAVFFVAWIAVSIFAFVLIIRELRRRKKEEKEIEELRRRLESYEKSESEKVVPLTPQPGTRVPEPGERL